jgi:spermidine/putrescine transport system permease protein
MKILNRFKIFSLSAIWVWLIIFALIPFIFTFTTSILTQDPTNIVSFKFTSQNYWQLLNRSYLKITLQSVYLAASCTLICLLIGYPFAFIIARVRAKFRGLFFLLVIIPFWTSSLIRTYAIMAIIKAKGILNTLLLTLGIIHQPLSILYSYTAVLIGCVYDFLPFMIVPLYANIEKLNMEYIEAARDLGAGKIRTFFKIIIPLTLPGIMGGIVLVFLPAMTMFYIPVLLGGAKNMLLGNLIESSFLTANNWPQGAAISIVITFIMSLLIFIYWKNSQDKDRQNLT